jgi:Na+/melibiose symporter-like transporter
MFRYRLAVTMLNWFANTFVYDGLSFNVSDILGGNLYLNYVYGACVELAGVSASHFGLEKFGRKKPYSICLLLAGASLVSIAFVPKSKNQLKNAIYLWIFKKFSLIFSY